MSALIQYFLTANSPSPPHIHHTISKICFDINKKGGFFNGMAKKRSISRPKTPIIHVSLTPNAFPPLHTNSTSLPNLTKVKNNSGINLELKTNR